MHQHHANIVARGPLLDDGGERTIGSLILLDVTNKTDAEAFWAGEPFNRAGVYETVTMERWRFGHV